MQAPEQKPTAPIYGKFARFARWLMRTFSHRYTCDFTVPEEPVVYVCRHLNMHGPYTTLKWLPQEVHPMILHVFFERETTVQHMREYTFAQRYGRKARKFSLAAFLMGFIAPPMMRSLQAVPVYRKGIRSVNTMKAGVKCLLRQENLIVFPDVHYRDGYDKPGEIYDGFLYIGELYCRKTGKPLSFVPLFIDDEKRVISAGTPVKIRNFHEEEADAVRTLIREINPHTQTQTA